MLETLGNLGDFIGGIAVVITLIYLVMQVRQNTNATRLATLQGIMGMAQQLNAGISRDHIPRVLAKLRRGEPLDDEEIVAYRFHLQGALTNQWQVFYQHRHGLVEDEILAAYERRNSLFWSQRFFRWAWPEMRVGYPPDFQSYMDRLIELVPEEAAAAP
jgi:hypothetical protein